jgi:hypothetical protein
VSRSATASDVKPYSLSNSYNPRLNVPTTRKVRLRAIGPIGVMFVSELSTRTESPTLTPRFWATSFPRMMPSG